MKLLKTPLRYPGGKSRALTKIVPHIPDLSSYSEYREPFLGGGSVAIQISKMYPTLDVWVNDLYTPLCIFWQQLQERGDEMSEAIWIVCGCCADSELFYHYDWYENG